MRKIKEVLRLKYEANLSFRQIAASLKLSVAVISKYTQAAEVAGVSWPLPEGLDDATLEARLFPLARPVRGNVLPDCAHIHRELTRKGGRCCCCGGKNTGHPAQVRHTSMRSSTCITANTATASNSRCGKPTRPARSYSLTTAATGFLSLIEKPAKFARHKSSSRCWAPRVIPSPKPP